MSINGTVERLVLEVTATGQRQLDGVYRSYTAVSGAAVTATAAAAAWAIGQAAAIDEAVKHAAALQMDVEAFSAWTYAADRSGLSAEQFSTGLRALTVQLEAASRDTGEGLPWLRKAGIDATDAEGRLRTAADVLPELADAYRRLETDGERAAFTTRLLGESGGAFASLLDEGSEGIDVLIGRAHELGVVLDNDAGDAAAQLNDSWTDLRAAGSGLANMVSSEIIPAVVPLVDNMTALLTESDGFVRSGVEKSAEAMAWGFRQLNTSGGQAVATLALIGAGIGTAQTAGTMLGGLSAASPAMGMVTKGLGGMVTAAGPWLLVGAAVALVFDDIATAARGGDSALLRAAHAMGIGEAASDGLQASLKGVPALFDAVGLAADEAGSRLERAIEQWIPGLQVAAEYAEGVRDAVTMVSSNLLGLGYGYEAASGFIQGSSRGYQNAAAYMAGDPNVFRTGGFDPTIGLADSARVSSLRALDSMPGQVPHSVVAPAQTTVNQMFNISAQDARQAARDAARQAERATYQSLSALESNQ